MVTAVLDVVNQIIATPATKRIRLSSRNVKWPQLKAVVGSNRCQVAVAADGETVVAISSIDNLVKGAAGQAVQNLNLVMGWPQAAGLDTLRGSHP